MTPNSPVGLVIGSNTPPEQIPNLAWAAERAGFAELWTVEDYFYYGGLTATAVALANTTSIPVGFGITSALVRHPAVLAMEVATLERLYPGRVWPGVGLGVFVEKMGFHPPSPLSVIRDATTALRALFAGEVVTASGAFTLDGVQLAYPPATMPPIYAGVLGPKMLQMAGEVADGIVASALSSAAYIRWLRQHAKTGRQAAGRDGEGRVVTYAMYAVDSDAKAAKDSLRGLVAFYLSVLPSASLFEVYGIREQVEEMCTRGGSEAAALIAREMPEQWLDDLVIAGEPDECTAKIRALLDAGSDSVCLYPATADRATDMMDLTAKEIIPQLI
jgi:alkanesulfonate monooxygenase SsuD/methylene tetrahydromethanopterin reductase-like flavin-dependent oxidoreductase (luciferase family)